MDGIPRDGVALAKRRRFGASPLDPAHGVGGWNRHWAGRSLAPKYGRCRAARAVRGGPAPQLQKRRLRQQKTRRTERRFDNLWKIASCGYPAATVRHSVYLREPLCDGATERSNGMAIQFSRKNQSSAIGLGLSRFNRANG